MNFSLRNIIIGIVVLILAVAVPVTIKLVQQQQQLKSQAAGEFICSGSASNNNFCIQFLDDAERTGNIVVGRNVAVIVVGRSGETKVSLDGTYKTSDVDVLYSGGGTNPCTGDQSYQYCWKFSIPSVTNQVYRETFKSEDAPAGLVAGNFQPQAPLAQTVTIGGRVTTSDGTPIEGVVINQNAINPTNCNIGITPTDSSGNYRFTVDKGKQFCLRPPQDSNHRPIAPIAEVGAPASPTSYEQLTATADKTDFDFVYTPASPAAPVPSNQAVCESITIDGQDFSSSIPTVKPGSSHPIEIIMRNPPSDSKNTSKSWQSGYSLKFTSGTQAANALGLNTTLVPLTTRIEPQQTFESGDNITITPPGTSSGKYNFFWQMHDGSGTPFGGQCKREIIVGSAGGPDPTPTPVPGVDLFSIDARGLLSVRPGTTDKTVYKEIEVSKRGTTSGNPQISLSVTGTLSSGVEMIFPISGQSRSCTPGTDNPCERSIQFNISPNAQTARTNWTVTGKFGTEEHSSEFQLDVIGGSTGGFDFEIIPPSKMTITKGQLGTQCSAGQPCRGTVTVNKKVGTAQAVTLSTNLNTGGAEPIFTPSSCTPTTGSCISILTFNATGDNIIPGTYSPTVQGQAGSMTNTSNPFTLTVDPSSTPTPTPTSTPSSTPTPSPTPTPTPAPVKKTLCFAFGEGPEGKTAVDGVKDCSNIDNKLVFPYTSEPAKITGYAFKDQTPGVKTIFVKFIGVLGTAPVSDSKQLSIRLNPNPTISNASCTHSSSGVGTDIKITGTGFRAQGKGKVKVGGQELTPDSWDETTNIITGKLDQRLEGRIGVEVTTDDGRSAKGECVVNTTTITFKTLMQCKSAGSFAASNVDIKVFEALPLSTDARAPEPILRQKISLNKDGEPQNFAPKFEKKKKYQLIIKAPGTIARRVDFDTKDGGTTNLEGVINLPQGDVAPANSPDGKINALDKSEMIRQWNIITDVAKSADLNGDSRVNSIDYACMRLNFNATDDTYSAPVPSPSPSPSALPTPSATPDVSPTPSPTPGGGTGGTAFRISFDPLFPPASTQQGTVDPITGEAIMDITLPEGAGVKNVYVQFSEDGGVTWGPTPPTVATITLL